MGGGALIENTPPRRPGGATAAAPIRRSRRNPMQRYGLTWDEFFYWGRLKAVEGLPSDVAAARVISERRSFA